MYHSISTDGDYMSQLENIIANLDMRKYRKIGEGCSRVVYKAGNYVIKKAKNKRGLLENSNENRIYQLANRKLKDYLCPVFYCDDKYIIMAYCDELTDSEFESCHLIRQELSKQLFSQFSLDDFDLSYKFNWGKIGNRLFLIDYGHDYFE